MTEAVGVWEAPAEATTYRKESREFGELDLTLTRRSLSYPEEVRLMAAAKDAKSKQIDWLEFLALTVELTVQESNFDLTGRRCRTFLADRPKFAWFLIKWLCGDTLQNARPDALEDLRKKHGP